MSVLNSKLVGISYFFILSLMLTLLLKWVSHLVCSGWVISCLIYYCYTTFKKKTINVSQPNHCICVHTVCTYIKISVFSQIWHKQIQKETEYLIPEWISRPMLDVKHNTDTNELLREVKILLKNVIQKESHANLLLENSANESNVQIKDVSYYVCSPTKIFCMRFFLEWVFSGSSFCTHDRVLFSSKLHFDAENMIKYKPLFQSWIKLRVEIMISIVHQTTCLEEETEKYFLLNICSII